MTGHIEESMRFFGSIRLGRVPIRPERVLLPGVTLKSCI